MAYQYRGKLRGIEPEPDASKCGTYAGYRQHRRDQEPVCDPCRTAQAEYSRDYHRRTSGKAPEDRITPRRGKGKAGGCGTHAGHAAHRRLGTKPCEPCRLAYNAYKKLRRITLGTTKGVVVPADLSCPNCGHHVAVA